MTTPTDTTDTSSRAGVGGSAGAALLARLKDLGTHDPTVHAGLSAHRYHKKPLQDCLIEMVLYLAAEKEEMRSQLIKELERKGPPAAKMDADGSR